MTETSPIDVRDMAIVHRTFRRAFDESATLVRANPTPSAQRVVFLADHIDFCIGLLHTHHASEDELLYPLLLARAPEQTAAIEQTGHEHVLVNDTIESVTEACAVWRVNPTTESGERLAVALDTLNETLQPHLDHEERDIVSLAAVTLTQAEWDALGEHATSHIPRKMMPVAFGMLLEPLDEDDRARMKRELPAPVRLLFGPLIQRPWNKYAKTLRSGT